MAFLLDPLGAGVLVALVAEHAVVHLAEHLAGVHARIGELEAVATPKVARRRRHELFPRVIEGTRRVHQVLEIQRLRQAEGGPSCHVAPARRIEQTHPAPFLHQAQYASDRSQVRSAGIGGILIQKGRQKRRRRGNPGELGAKRADASHYIRPQHRTFLRRAGRQRCLQVHQLAGEPSQRKLGVGGAFQQLPHASIDLLLLQQRKVLGLHVFLCATPKEIHLEAENRVFVAGGGSNALQLLHDAKEPCYEATEVRPHVDQKIGDLLWRS